MPHFAHFCSYYWNNFQFYGPFILFITIVQKKIYISSFSHFSVNNIYLFIFKQIMKLFLIKSNYSLYYHLMKLRELIFKKFFLWRKCSYYLKAHLKCVKTLIYSKFKYSFLLILREQKMFTITKVAWSLISV